MSAIRPLATIAVLAALGVFLALKINERGPIALEGAADLKDELAAPWKEPGAMSAIDEAPAFDPSKTSLTPRTAPADGGLSAAPAFAPSTPTEEKTELPSLPPLPSLPGAPAGPTLEPNTPAPPAAAQTTPPSRYATPAASQTTAAAPPAVSGRVPSLGTATPDITPMAPERASASPFDAAWPMIQAALDRDEITRAHLLLSQWRNEPSLTDNQRKDIDVLLDDLAGTVVYSMEHRLEPPHTVKPGETLATIAEQYGTTWQLLGKINGLTRVDSVQPGETLKIVRGPFTAEVSLAEGELVLLLDGRYAGRFPVRVDGAASNEGVWRVDQKSVTPSQSPRLVLQGASGAVSLDDSPVADPAYRGRITVAARDATDLTDILSVGSTVTIRR